jgi:hypothetical protein
MSVYSEMLTDNPLDRRAQEGLLAAAAGIGDGMQLADGWQQVCASLDGDVDVELQELYERLPRELSQWSGSNRGNADEEMPIGVGRIPIFVPRAGK